MYCLFQQQLNFCTLFITFITKEKMLVFFIVIQKVMIVRNWNLYLIVK